MDLYSELVSILEAPGNLAGLPPAFIKIATKVKLGGENSEKKLIAGASSFKDYYDVLKISKTAVKALGEYSFVWAEFNGTPIVGVYTGYDEYSVTIADGTSAFVTKQTTVRGTDKWDRKSNSYIPPKYFNQKIYRFKQVSTAAEVFSDVIQGSVDNMVAETGLNASEIMKNMKIEVFGLTVDQNRINLRQQRYASRARSDDSLGKEAVKKLVKQKLGPLIQRIKTSIPTAEEIENAIDSGNSVHIIPDLEGDISKLNRIISRLHSLGNVPQRTAFNKEKPELSWDYKALFDLLRDI